MDKYIEFKNTLEEKYINSALERTEGVISLYDLIDLLEMGFDDLKLTMDGSALREQINRDRTVFERIGLFRKKAVVNQKCTSVISNYNRKKCRISFGFENRGSRTGHEFVVLIKDRDSDELYFESEQFANKEFADKYVSEIYGMFAVLEEYADYYPLNGKGETTAISQTFDDGVLSVTISVYVGGTVHYTILPSKGTDPEKIFTREWVSRTKLSSIVVDNAVSILDSIPVSISSLNEAYRSVVEKELKKENDRLLRKTIGGMAN